MSRIRSIHPGLFTDEAFVSLSMAARVLLPGVWTECDDHGVFEWKPITLKMKLFPADNVDVPALLDELLTADAVKKFTVDGKCFGVMRNFSKYQRPKNPSYRFNLPDEYRTYAGLKGEHPPSPTPALPEGSPIPTEKSPQMEDGEERKEEDKHSLRSEAPQKKSRRKPQIALPADWSPSESLRAEAKKLGLSESEINREVVRFRNHAAQTDRRCANWDAAFQNWCIKAAEFLNKPPPSDNVVPIDPNKFYAAFGSAELDAWDAYCRRTKGCNQMRDKRGGWLCDARWPPGYEPQAATA